MATYLLTAPASISLDATAPMYVDAAPNRPQEVNLPDDFAPSRTWIPLDAGAQAALAKLGIRRPVHARLSVRPPIAGRRPLLSEQL